MASSLHIFKIGILALMASTALSACTTLDRIKEVGNKPTMSPLVNIAAPVRMPMPMPAVEKTTQNSLWRIGARAFFKDQRAARIGDILTVNIQIDDSANINNTTTRSRTNTEDANINNFLGLESQITKVLPEAFSPGAAVGLGSGSSSEGTGRVQRSESISLSIAAVVSDVLPNGNMVIQGRQEVRINFEVRELMLAGVVRPEDISALNTISHTQIAEARISYGGRGQLSDVQQPRYGQQVYDILFPF